MTEEQRQAFQIAADLRYTFFRDEQTKRAFGWILGSVRTLDSREPADMPEAVLRGWGARLLAVMKITDDLGGVVDVLSEIPMPVMVDHEEDTT